MSIQNAPEVSIKWINKAEVDNDKKSEIEPRSEIVLNGNKTGKFIDGAVLEKAVKLGRFYFLMVTFDCPFEESLGLRFFDNDFNLLDSAHLIIPYNTGYFCEFELIQPNKVRFEFFETKWTVELFENWRPRIPVFLEDFVVWRWFGFRRHFKVLGELPRPRPVWWKYWEKFKSRGGKL